MRVAYPYGPKRMVPLSDRATEGRVNAKGIPCLYLATEPHTAMSEVRPWPNATLTLAKFHLRKHLRLVNCAEHTLTIPLGIEINTRKWTSVVWGAINDSFSRPVSPSDNIADYAPTQVLAEAFRRCGYDGIVYRSSLGKGLNVAIFDCAVAKVGERYLCHVESLEYSFSNPIKTPKRTKR